ncbi:MAG: hypothetical protein O2973_11970 [Gemmatimonadetes bacterium]|nr:hypothetical protein [Gemmatimonadota bacterium]
MTDAPTVESLSALYLGNILYALERCAMALESEGKAEDAAFYRGIGRSLADALGRERRPAQPANTGSSGPNTSN